MPPSKRNAEDVRALCAQIHADDGVDPREDKRRAMDRTKKQDRKLMQLCKQVANALQLVLPNIYGLEASTVLGATPAPNAGRLRVMVSVPDSTDVAQLVDLLERSSGFLRSEMAQAVSRRRVPELVFSIVMEANRDA